MKVIEKTLTSLEVAEMVDRQHSEVLKDVRRIDRQLPEGEIHLGDYFVESEYRDPNNQKRPQYLLTKKGCELYATRMTGKKGTQFAVKYIERFNEMEQHIKQNELDTSQFSPELQALIGIEQRQNEQDERLDTVEKKQDDIKEIFTINTFDWREKVKKIISKIGRENGGIYDSLWNKTYNDLEVRARCNLNRRLNNIKERALKHGATKREIRLTNNLDVIDRDQKLKEIYLTIIKELALKYGLGSDDLWRTSKYHIMQKRK